MTAPIKIAQKIAQFSNIKRAKVSAIAFSSSGHVIAMAHNRRINCGDDRWTEHAEESLINKLNRINAWQRFKNISILVLRMSAHGISMAKPCSRCQLLLKKYPVKIMYTDSDGTIQPLN